MVIKEIRKGMKVLWNDPQFGIESERIYEVYNINGEDNDAIILIGDEFSEVEVLASELIRVP